MWDPKIDRLEGERDIKLASHHLLMLGTEGSCGPARLPMMTHGVRRHLKKAPVTRSPPLPVGHR